MTTIQERVMLQKIGQLAIEWVISEKSLSIAYELHKNRRYDLRNPVPYEQEIAKAISSKKILEETCQAYIKEQDATHDKEP